ncbi:MAG: acyltransferase [Verrucomicrobia bacterium]|nr:acyltransferase [Verrucomicrobiota bacterium]
MVGKKLRSLRQTGGCSGGESHQSTGGRDGFFVVSGLCIHLPQAGAATPYWPAFFIRRYMRLGLPLAGALALGLLLSAKNFSGTNRVSAMIWIWTLLVELIFYSIYPVLLVAVRRWGWRMVTALSLVLSGILLASNLQVLHPGEFGVVISAMIYLPVWLSGCHLGERLGTCGLPTATLPRLWGWRAAVLEGFVVTSLVLYHAPVGWPPVRYPAAVIGVGFLASRWLGYEMARCSTHPPFRWLEWCGSWSYSLYITHFMWFGIWIRLVDQPLFPGVGTPLEFFPRLAFIFAATVLFYFACERPSHIFARDAGRWLDKSSRRKR